MRLVDGAVSDILSLLAHAGAAPRKASSRAGGRSAKLYLGDVRVRFSGCRFSSLSQLEAIGRSSAFDGVPVLGAVKVVQPWGAPS